MYPRLQVHCGEPSARAVQLDLEQGEIMPWVRVGRAEGGKSMIVSVIIKPVCTLCTYEVVVVLSQGQSWHCNGSPEGLLLK